MIILSSAKIKNISIILLFFSALSLWLVGRRVTSSDSNEPGISNTFYDDNLFESTLTSICEHVPNTDESNVILEDLSLSLAGVNFNNADTLAEFCKPYIYTKFYLRLGMKNDGHCAQDSVGRGEDCEWYHMCVWPPTEDRYISAMILQGGIWEGEMISILVNTIRGKPTGIVIDAGANIGQYTLAAALLGHRVFSFEPIPQHVDMIKRSLALNGVSNRVFMFRNALSDYNARTYISFHKDNKGGSTIERINGSSDESDPRFIQGSRISIDLITLDDVLPFMNLYRNMEIIYWKADIEGYEPRMFSGAWKLIESRRPPFIIFEILGKSFERTQCYADKFLRGLMKLGYTVSPVNKEPLQEDMLDAWTEVAVKNKLHFDLILKWNSTKK